MITNKEIENLPGRSDFLYPRFDFNIYDGKMVINHSAKDLKRILAYEMEKCKEDDVWKLANQNFVDDHEEPFELTPAQLEIFKCIYYRDFDRVHIVSSTQYGKTLNIASALLARISSHPEDWLVTVPDLKRGRNLLKYMINATSKNEYFKRKLIGVKDKDHSAMNRLLEEKSKIKLTYQILGKDDNIPRYGSVELITCEAHRTQDAIESIMGFGGRNVISDESSLISDEIEAGIFRMFAGKGKDTCYIKIGNPFHRNHFYKSFVSKRYKKIFIKKEIGLADGRYTPEFIEEAMEKPKSEILYDCEYPPEDAEDADGWSKLLLGEDVKRAILPEIKLIGPIRLGVDCAGGGKNQSVIVARGINGARVLWQSRTRDTMKIAEAVYDFAIMLEVDPKEIFIDMVGLGRGASDRLAQLIGRPCGVNVGQAADAKVHKKEFTNLRALAFWRVRTWILREGRLEKHTGWEQLSHALFYKLKKSKVQMMPKETMRKKGIVSPDYADALMLTFTKKDEYFETGKSKKSKKEDDFFKNKMKKKRLRNKSFRTVQS